MCITVTCTSSLGGLYTLVNVICEVATFIALCVFLSSLRGIAASNVMGVWYDISARRVTPVFIVHYSEAWGNLFINSVIICLVRTSLCVGLSAHAHTQVMTWNVWLHGNGLYGSSISRGRNQQVGSCLGNATDWPGVSSSTHKPRHMLHAVFCQ